MLADYPPREYPEPEVAPPKKGARGAPPPPKVDPKKAPPPKKKKKVPPFPTPDWAIALEAVVDTVKSLEQCVQQRENLELTPKFLENVKSVLE